MKDFDILFKEGRFLGGNFVALKLWKIDPKKYPRRKYSSDDLKIGFVVGVKVHKSAVKRNRIKRQLREIVRLLLKEGKIKSGFLVAVMAKKDIIGIDYKKIKEDLINIMSAAFLLNG